MALQHFIDIADLNREQARELLARSIADKKEFRRNRLVRSLAHKTLAMIFEKPSLRTRVSFEAAMSQLGGHGIYLSQADIGIGSREAIQDIARVLGRMCDAIVARTFSHELVCDLARFSPAPVINALTDYSHPCQAMADIMTAQEHFGHLAGRTLAFVGDGNNVARSLAMLCAKVEMKFVLACPAGYELQEDFLAHLRDNEPGASCLITSDPVSAVRSADVVYTDTWTSMGQEEEKAKRMAAFKPFQVNADLMAKAPAHAIVMHCLPAYRGNEISDEMMEKYADIIFDEAENRLHFQRSLLNLLIAEGGIE